MPSLQPSISALPSSSPTKQIPKVEIISEGKITIILSPLDVAAYKVFLEALGKILELIQCQKVWDDGENCEVILYDPTLSSRRLRRLNGRRLSTAFQYTITISVECPESDCSNAEAVAKSAMEDAQTSINTATTTNEFATTMQDAINTAIAALPNQQAVTSNYFALFTFAAAAGVLSSPVVTIYSGKFYADWVTTSCKNDDNYPPYMDGSDWISPSLNACCGKHFSWDYDACIENSINPHLGPKVNDFATNKWYVNWSRDTFCVKDCEITNLNPECGGIAGPSVTLYPTSEACCAFNHPWMDPKLCAQKSELNTARTEKWFVDYSSGSCAKDCADPSDPSCEDVTDLSVALYDSALDCCRRTLPWVNEMSCQVASEHSNDGYTNQYYVSHREQVCQKDCNDPNDDECKGHPEYATDSVYSTKELCCENGLPWVNKNICVGGPNGSKFTELFYVEYTSQECHQDCNDDTNSDCKGNSPDSYVTLYTTKEECCKEQLSWLSTNVCVSGNSGFGTMKWYVDWTANGYIGMCKQDCAVSTSNESCGGIVENTWQSLFNTPDSCCKTGLSWLKRTECTHF